MRSAPVLAASLAWLASAAAPAVAAPLFTDVASPDAIVTFEEIVLAPNTVVSNQYAGLGISFGTTIYYDPVSFPNVGDFFSPIHSGHAVGNMFGFQPGQQVVPIDLFFTNPVSAASVRVVLNTQLFVAEARLGGVLVETSDRSTSGCSVQSIGCATVGFEGIVFDQIRLTDFAFPSVRLDTIAYSVPEPGAALLLGSALLAGGCLRRGRRTGRPGSAPPA